MKYQDAINEVRFNMSTIGLKESAAARVIEARDIAIQAIQELESYKISEAYCRGYSKGVRELAERLKKEHDETIPTHSGYTPRTKFDEIIDEIAEEVIENETHKF